MTEVEIFAKVRTKRILTEPIPVTLKAMATTKGIKVVAGFEYMPNREERLSWIRLYYRKKGKRMAKNFLNKKVNIFMMPGDVLNYTCTETPF